MASGKLFQVLTAFACGFGSFVMGALFVWPSYASLLLTSANTTLVVEPLTANEESLLSSLPSLGAIVGSAMVGPLIDNFGRKLGGATICLSYVISWSMLCMSKSSILILVSRFFGGLGGGASLVFAPIFISEVVEDSIRGMLASVPMILFNFGALSSYLMGWFLEYHTIAYINLSCGVLCCILLLSVPESPVYLMKKNRDEDARASMATYRGVSPSSMIVQKELIRIQQQITPALELKTGEDDVEKEKFASEDLALMIEAESSAIKTLFKSQASRRAFLTVLSVISMQAIMGMGPVQVYAKHLFTQADPANADLYSVILAVVVVSGNLVTGAIADKAGRRFLVIASSTLVAVCMVTLGVLLQTKAAPSWVTVTGLLLFCFCFMCGAGPIPFVLMAEVFNSKVQGCASMLLIEWVWFMNFLILAVFTWLNQLLGIYGTFYIFAVNSVINAVLAYTFVPETKGLSNAQIQELFLGKKK